MPLFALVAALAVAAPGLVDSVRDVVEPQRPPPTVAQLAGQRVVYGFAGTAPPPSLVGRIRRGEAGAVIIMGGNVQSPRRLAQLTARLQAIPRPSAVDEPLLIMVDQEGGAVRRVPGPPFGGAGRMGAGDPGATRVAGRAAGRLLRQAGVAVNLAPVADVAGPGSTLAREGRTFGASPAAVSRHAVAFATGLRDAGVLATAKHFPGFGSARVNTDDAPVTIRRPAAVLRRVDMRPFRELIAHDVPLVMTSSAVYAALHPGTPALLSRTVVTGALPTRPGCRGLVVTAALARPAAVPAGGDAAVAVRAAGAGNDLLVYIDERRAAAAAAGLRAALGSGRLRHDEAHAALERILEVRRRLPG